MKKSVWKNLAFAVGGVALIVLVWIVAWAAVGNELIVPAFSDCVKEFFRLFFSDGGFWNAFLGTLLRVFVAFAISFVLAGGFAVVSYLLPSFFKFFSPIVAFLRSVPVLAVLLVILVWTDAGVAPVAVAFLSLFPMLYAGILSALMEVDGALIEMSRVYRVPLKTRIRRLYIPSIAPFVVREAGAALGFSVKLVVSAEVLSRTKVSLGLMMQDAQIFSEMPALFALVIAACAVGFAFDRLGDHLAKRLQRRGK